MRRLASRFSDWVIRHPVMWVVCSAVVVVLIGVALELPPVLIIAVGAAVGAINILHARRRGYCPLPEEPGAQSVRGEAETPR